MSAWISRIFLSFVISTVACVWSVAQQGGELTLLTKDELNLHVLSRLTFGPTLESIREIETDGVDRWVERQLKLLDPDANLAVKLQRFSSLNLPIRRIYEQFDQPRSDEDTPEETRRKDLLRSRPAQELKGSVLWRAVENQGQVAEVLAEFWRNHFNIDVNKDAVGYAAIEWETKVIRRHIFSRFDEFLHATAQHPAMLLYLDNVVSRRPPNKTELKTITRTVRQRTGSRERGEEAARIAEQNGLNENYARELMELHSLGVDNGYTQKDVIALAEALTGWTVQTANRAYTFDYRDTMHVEGDKFFMGQVVAREKKRNGQAEGEAIIDILARHPNTAEFLARKLCIYLVADEPPDLLVKNTAAHLRSTRFDLASVVSFIIRSPEMRERRHYRTKFKTPFEFVASALRATSGTITGTDRLVQIVADMGQPIYGCEDPTGYRDTAESWRDPGVMAARWRFALALAANRIDGVEIPDSYFDDVRGQGVPVLVARLAKRVLPAGMRDQTIKAIFKVAFDHARKIQTGKSIEVPLERRVLGVLIGSPEFQEQ